MACNPKMPGGYRYSCRGIESDVPDHVRSLLHFLLTQVYRTLVEHYFADYALQLQFTLENLLQIKATINADFDEATITITLPAFKYNYNNDVSKEMEQFYNQVILSIAIGDISSDVWIKPDLAHQNAQTHPVAYQFDSFSKQVSYTLQCWVSSQIHEDADYKVEYVPGGYQSDDTNSTQSNEDMASQLKKGTVNRICGECGKPVCLVYS